MKHKWMQQSLKVWVVTLLLSCGVSHVAYALVGSSPTQLQSIVFLSDSKKFVQDWLNPANKSAPRIVALKQAELGKPLFLGMIAYMPSSMKGSRPISVSVRVVGPDGGLVIDLPNYAKLQVDLPEEGGYVLIDPPLDLRLSTSDMAGEYHAYVHIQDEITGKKAFGDYLFSLRNL